jgi:hypothetical protein
MLRCLKDGCPWNCGTRRNPNCAERIMTCALGWALFLTLLVTLIWGAVAIRDRHDVSFSPTLESAAASEGIPHAAGMPCASG